MALVRIATKGWDRCAHAETAEDVGCGVMMPWVEIDGYRIEDATSAQIVVADDDFNEVTLVVKMNAVVELVYLDRHGEPLLTEVRADESLPRQVFDCESIVWREGTEPPDAVGKMPCGCPGDWDPPTPVAGQPGQFEQIGALRDRPAPENGEWHIAIDGRTHSWVLGEWRCYGGPIV